MRQSWHYSICMLVVYVGLFLLWMLVPSRSMFLVTGSLAIAGLVWGMRRAQRVGYFVNQVDWRLHALVILDLILETTSFELFRLFQPLAVVESFHSNTNFIGCATAFTLLIGCYRYFTSRKQVPATAATATAPQS